MWDYRNRMTAAWVAGATTTYAYDHTIARMAQRTSTTTSHYPNKFYSIDYAGTSTTTATSTAYIWHGDTLVAYIEQRIANGVPSGTPTTYYVHPDHLGSANVVTNASGTPVETLDYYPYGAERIHSGTADLDRTFIGQFGDDPTALSYLNARYYDPARGQFASQDPTHLGIGDAMRLRAATGFSQDYFLADPQLLNSYAYGRGNPVRYSDPNGNCPWCLPFLIGGAAGGVGFYATDVLNNRAEGLTGWDAYAPRSSWQEYNAAVVGGALTGAAATAGIAYAGIAAVGGSVGQDLVGEGDVDLGKAALSGVVTIATGGAFKSVVGGSPGVGVMRSTGRLSAEIPRKDLRYAITGEAFQNSVGVIAQSNYQTRSGSPVQSYNSSGRGTLNSVLSSLSRALSALSKALSGLQKKQ